MRPHPLKDDVSIVEFSSRPLTLKEAQAIVGGHVQMLVLDDDSQLLVHEEGRLLGMAINVEATRRWPNWGPLLGPVVHMTGAARWK